MDCPNCHASLEAPLSLEPFPCPFCNTELVNHPLLEERNRLSARRAKLAEAAPGRGCMGPLLLALGTLTLMGSLFGESGRDTISMSLLALLLGVALTTRARKRNPEIEEIDQRIASIDRSLL
jgi:hypothetical protein